MSVSTLFTRGLVSEMQQRGVAVVELMRDTGLTLEQLTDIHGRAPVEALTALGRNALTLTRDQELGLSIAQNAPVNVLQVLSHMMLACRTLRQALDAFQRHAPHVAPGASWELYEHQQLAYVYYERDLPDQDVARVVADGVLLMLVRLAQVFSPQFQPEEVWFRHACPGYAERYLSLFRCPVLFGKTRNALVFRRELLDAEQQHADETMLNLLHDATSRLLYPSDEPRGLAEKVRVLLANERSIGAATIGMVSLRLNMSQRTLRRRLAEEGFRFTELLDEVRCDVACSELHKRGGTIKGAADRVGFSDRSSFHRAFKRWTGKTPQEYMQEKHLSGGLS